MESAQEALLVPSQTPPDDPVATIPTANDFQNSKRVLERDESDRAAKNPCLEDVNVMGKSARAARGTEGAEEDARDEGEASAGGSCGEEDGDGADVVTELMVVGEEVAPQTQGEVAAQFKHEVRVERNEIGKEETMERNEIGEEEPHRNRTQGTSDVEESHAEKPVNAVTDLEGGKGEVKLGPKTFSSSVEMFDYFYHLLHGWPVNINVNKYEHMVLLDLIEKGHSDPQQKIGAGIKAFQIRVNPEYYSRCYYVVHQDGTADNFSYRKCVDKLLPLPSNMKSASGNLDIDSILSLKKNGHNDSGQEGLGHDGGKMEGFHHNKGRGGTFGRRGRFGRGGRFNGRHGGS